MYVSLPITIEDAQILLMSVQDDESSYQRNLFLRLAGCIRSPRNLDLAEADAWYLWHRVKLNLAIGKHSGKDIWLKLTMAILATYPDNAPKIIPLTIEEDEDASRSPSESTAESDTYDGA